MSKFISNAHRLNNYASFFNILAFSISKSNLWLHVLVLINKEISASCHVVRAATINIPDIIGLLTSVKTNKTTDPKLHYFLKKLPFICDETNNLCQYD